MALIECYECGQSFSEQVKACVHCGADKVHPDKKKKKDGMNALIGIAAFIALLSWFGNSSEPRPYVVGEDHVGALLFCQFMVENNLKSPATAKFERGASTNLIKHAGDDLYIMNSYVDSENGFGATLRTNFRCKAQRLGEDQWKTIELKIK